MRSDACRKIKVMFEILIIFVFEQIRITNTMLLLIKIMYKEIFKVQNC